jgi:hypothetical protein
MKDSRDGYESRSVSSRDTATGSARDVTVERADEQPLTEDEKDTVKAASTPATAAAGAVAGATAGLATGVFGPIGMIVGAIVGGVGGAAAGAAGAVATDNLYTAEHDAHYQALWEGGPDHAADRTFEAVRPAYQFGHIAAQQPEFAGRYFGDVEPELRRRWPDELRTRAGEWGAVRRYVEDGYSHARSQGLGERRDRTVVGSAGSAVDPVELERARAGLPSVEGPGQNTQNTRQESPGLP